MPNTFSLNVKALFTVKVKPESLRLTFDTLTSALLLKPKVITNPGEVISIEYQVENISDEGSTGIATFSYYPKSFGNYISKLNCFCYDAQNLGPKEKMKYAVVLLIDPKVTKDSKTKNVKEVTIQFTFFDYKKYKEVEK